MAKKKIKWKSATPTRRDIAITVIADPDPIEGISWSQQIADPQYGADDNVICPAGVGYRITFSLQDNTTKQIQFNVAKPIFVKEGKNDPCPSRKGSNQIKPDSCTSDVLVITNWNYGKARSLRYQLNFVDPAGSDIDPPYDPIMDNGGGGTQPLCWD
jgi:hypothetical protein